VQKENEINSGGRRKKRKRLTVKRRNKKAKKGIWSVRFPLAGT